VNGISQLLLQAQKTGTSDLHLKPDSPLLTRKCGELVPITKQPMPAETVKELVFSILSEKARAEFEKNLEYDFAYQDANLRARVNVFMVGKNVGAIFRFIPIKPPTFESLGLPEILKEMAMKPKGLIVVTGPASSGKSSTIAALVEFMNENRKDHIITLEAPIEFVYESKVALIDQREVPVDTDSFLDGLRYALRQDPDICVIGEMRDLETIQTALQTAETGHLVLSTLHTSSAIGTISRLINSFPPHQREEIRIQLSLNIQGVVSQILLPSTDRTRMHAAYEILCPTFAIRNLIRTNNLAQVESTIQTDGTGRMRTLKSDVERLIRQKLVSKQDAANYLTVV
jgi:twitching motility protein PilT